jgi:hypothetical protein
MPEFHRDEPVTLELDDVAGKRSASTMRSAILPGSRGFQNAARYSGVDPRRIFSTTPGTANARDPGKRSRITLRPNQ